MICPVCEKLGLKSKTHANGGRKTMMYCKPYYDENGKYHHHDANRISTTYTCTNGHAWTRVTRGKCWCGWSGGETTIKIIKGEE